MPTIGTDIVTSIVNRHIIPEIVDNIYNAIPVWYRLNSGNKKMVQGGTHIELPLQYKRFNNGGPYSGREVLNTTANDTVKNMSLNWKQHYVPVEFSGIDLAKVDTPDAIVNLVSFKMDQAQHEMAANLSDGMWSDGTTNPADIDGFRLAITDSGTYAGIARSTNTWWNAETDTTATMTATALNNFFMDLVNGGRGPTLIVSRADQYNRFWKLNQDHQEFPTQPGGHDVQLASAGFHNQLLNGVPWVIDSAVPDGSGGNSRIYFLNENFIKWVVHPRADFYMRPFQSPDNQDTISSLLLWYGNLLVTNPGLQGVMTSITA